MRETWLKTNWRLHLPLMLVKALFLAIILVLLARSVGGWVTVALAAKFLIVYVALFYFLTRYFGVLSYAKGHLCVYRGRMPIACVPIELVEGFLLGQGPSYLPGKSASRLDVATVVVKLADRAEEWEHQEMDSR